MKNTYDFLNDATFDENSLVPGEIGVEPEQKFAERDNKGLPVIELSLVLFWAADEANKQHIGKTFKWPIFFGGNSSQTPRILMGIFKRAGFEVQSWLPDTEFEPSIMIPGAIKLLAYKKVPLIGKITPGTRADMPRNFFNPLRITRTEPDSGEEYPDALPEPVPNALVLEAYHAVFDSDSVSDMV